MSKSIPVAPVEIEKGPPYRFCTVVITNGHETREFTVTAKDGLLWHNGKLIPLPEADRLAWLAGFMCAERLVKALGGAVREEREW